MRKIISKIGLSLVLILLTFFVFAPVASAVDSGIQISPLTFNFDILPGGSKEGKINIHNYNNEAINYTTEIELFAAVSEEGAPSFKQDEKKEGVTSLVDWITITANKEGAIATKQSVDIPFKIDVPTGAEPGGHYAAIFAKQIIKNAEGKTELGIASRVGALILVSVPGATDKSAKIAEFKPPKIVWRGPVDLSLKVENTGTVHYDSAASIKIAPLWGAETSIDLGTHTLIPQSPRLYKGTWGNKYPFGYYKLTATAKDGNGSVVTREAILWAIPLVIVLPILIAAIIIILIIIYLRRHVRFVK